MIKEPILNFPSKKGVIEPKILRDYLKTNSAVLTVLGISGAGKTHLTRETLIEKGRDDLSVYSVDGAILDAVGRNAIREKIEDTLNAFDIPLANFLREWGKRGEGERNFEAIISSLETAKLQKGKQSHVWGPRREFLINGLMNEGDPEDLNLLTLWMDGSPVNAREYGQKENLLTMAGLVNMDRRNKVVSTTGSFCELLPATHELVFEFSTSVHLFPDLIEYFEACVEQMAHKPIDFRGKQPFELALKRLEWYLQNAHITLQRSKMEEAELRDTQDFLEFIGGWLKNMKQEREDIREAYQEILSQIEGGNFGSRKQPDRRKSRQFTGKEKRKGSRRRMEGKEERRGPDRRENGTD